MPGQLTIAVSEILKKHDVSIADTWHIGLALDEPTVIDPLLQERFLINRHFRQVLGMYDENTFDTRYCLFDQGSIEDWLRLFDSHVAPCIKRNTP